MEIGSQVGPYRIEGLLGQGGMAEVYKVWHTGLHRFEAMKVLLPHMTTDSNFVARFLLEIRTVAGLHHPHIAMIHAVSDIGDAQPYFTMELVEAGDLAEYIEANGAFSMAAARPILEQTAAALDYAHGRNLIHRDVKPANVLLKPEAHAFCVKLVDFGIVGLQRQAGSERLTSAGMIIGTPEYMSPEQGGSGAPLDHRTDQYSLAVIAYEMLCGEPPFKSDGDHSTIQVIMQHVRDAPRPLLELVPGLPRAANAAILKALAKDPAQRFASCGDFVAALFAATPVPRPGPPVGGGARRPPWPLLAGLALCIGVALVAVGVKRGGGGSEELYPPPTPMPTAVVPGPSHNFTDVAAVASKSVKAANYDYGPGTTLDGRADTAWNVENMNHGKGEWIQLSWPDTRTVTKISAIVGYDKYNYKPLYAGQPHMWFRNNRLKRATLHFSGGETQVVEFKDVTPLQDKEISPVRASWVRLTVDDVYLDMYGGLQKRWDDLAIAELQVWGHD